MTFTDIGDKLIEIENVENPRLRNVLRRRLGERFHFRYTDREGYRESKGYDDYSDYSDYSDKTHTDKHRDNHTDKHRDGAFDGKEYDPRHCDELGGHTDRGYSEYMEYYR